MDKKIKMLVEANVKSYKGKMNKFCGMTCKFKEIIKTNYGKKISRKYCSAFEKVLEKQGFDRYLRCYQCIEAEQQTTDAVNILYKRYIDDDSERIVELEKTRKDDKEERRIKLCLGIISGRYGKDDLINEDYDLMNAVNDDGYDYIIEKAEDIIYDILTKIT